MSSPTFVKSPHILYDSLYVRAGSPLPIRAHFFYKVAGMPVNSLWYSQNEPYMEVTAEETNMQRSTCLPAPCEFTIRHPFLCIEAANRQDLDQAKDCSFQFGNRSKITDLHPHFVSEARPHSFFHTSEGIAYCIPGHLKPFLQIDNPPLSEHIESEWYFNATMNSRTLAPLRGDLRMWLCLYGEYYGA